MSDGLKYRVIPHEASHRIITLSASERSNIEGLGSGGGCFLGVVIFVTIFGVALLALPGITNEVVYLLFGAVVAIAVANVVVALISFLIKGETASDMERRRTNEANRSEIRRVTSEAESLTSSVTYTYNSSTELANSLPEHLYHASRWLQHAENEYKDNAFSPFWDAVEYAAQQLALFNDKVQRLSGNADEYYRKVGVRLIVVTLPTDL